MRTLHYNRAFALWELRTAINLLRPTSVGEGNQQPSNNSNDSKSPKGGTSSFSSKVPRFPTEKISVSPSPGQYDPTVKEKIKGVVPMSKQLPRSSSPGRSSKSLSNNSKVCSNQSSSASFHSTRGRSSSGSTYGSSRTPSRGNGARSTIQLPFAPPKRTGIVRTATSGEGGARFHHHGSGTQPPTTKPKAPATTLRSNTYDAITRTAPNRPANRLMSGNPLPGSTIVRKAPARPISGNPVPGSTIERKAPARPSTAGATTSARTGPTILRAGTRASSANPQPKPRGASPARQKAPSHRPTVVTLTGSRRSSANPQPKPRGASPAREKAPSHRPTVVTLTGSRRNLTAGKPKSRGASPVRRRPVSPRPRATSSTPRKKSPVKSEELQIKKELDELMARKKAQTQAQAQAQAQSQSATTTSRDTSPTTGGSSRSSYSRSTAASYSRSSSRTTTTLDYSSQDVDEEEDTSRTWSSPSSSRSSRASVLLAESPPVPAEEVAADADTGTRRLSTNSNQSDRTTISWMDREVNVIAMQQQQQQRQQQHAVAMDPEMPEEYSSLTYIVDSEPLRTPFPSGVRKYFTHPSATTTDAEETSTKRTTSSPSEGVGVSTPFGVALGAPDVAVKPFKEMPSQDSYKSDMFEVCAAGVMASSRPPPPHMGDHMLGLGEYHKMASDVRPSPETISPSIKELPKSSSTPPAPAKATQAAGTLVTTKPRKDQLPHPRLTPLKPAGGNKPAKQVAPKARTVATKTTRGAATSPKRVNETESFPRAETKRKCSSIVHSFTTPRPQYPVILQKGHKYYLPVRNISPKPPLGKGASRLLGPVAARKRARTFEAVDRERVAHVTLKRRSSSAPSETELCVAAPPSERGGGVEEAEVEIATTSYEDTPPIRRRWHDQEEQMHGAGLSSWSDQSSCGIDIDVFCSDNNLTITAKNKRPRSAEKSRSGRNVATTRWGRPVDGKPPAKSILIVTAKQREQQQQQPQMKTVESEFRSSEKKSRSKSSPRRGSANSKCKSNARSSSLSDEEKLRPCVRNREPETPKSELSYTSSDHQTGSQSRSRSQSRSPSGSSRRSSSGARSTNTKDTTEKLSTGTVVQTKSAFNNTEMLSGKLEQRGKEGVPECHPFEIQLPKLTDDMQTSGKKPAGQYVRDSISLLDVIPRTAQKLSETFHEMLEGMRSYLTDSPYINLRRNELHEQMMAYINEADGNAFYIRQEVKTELHRCVTQINANLQELLYLNNCVQEERQISQKKNEELHFREEQLANGLEEYKRLNEGVQKKCDDWEYKCRKEQEIRRFIEGSKDLVEREVTKQRKELRDAEDEVAHLRREIKEFEKKLDEMKKVTLQKDAKFQAKLKTEEKTSQLNAELLAKVKDDKNAIQRTLHQMNESHIRLNNHNMAKIQDLEKQMKDNDKLLATVREEKRLVEQQLEKKNDYLKLVEGATVNLVRQTNPGRALPSMPQDFGLNEREVAVWEQLNLCRGRLAELEAENQTLRQERLTLIEKNNEMEHIYQCVKEHEGLFKGAQNEFTILEQPNAELVEEMEAMRAENKALTEKLLAREKHCGLAHEKIGKLQDLLNSLRISDTDDVQVATLQHQVVKLKAEVVGMGKRTQELETRCASQEVQLKQRDFFVRNQQRILESRYEVMDALDCRGSGVSTLEDLRGFGDTMWRRHNEPRRTLSRTDLRRSPSQIARNEQRIADLEKLVVKLKHDETNSHEQRLRLENTIAELELKLLKAERYKHLGIHLIPLSDNIFFCLKRQTCVLERMDDAARARVHLVDVDLGLSDVEIGRLDRVATGVVTADQFVEFLETVHSIVRENTRGGGQPSGDNLLGGVDADKTGSLKDSNGDKTIGFSCGYEEGVGKRVDERPAEKSPPGSRGRSPQGGKPEAEKPVGGAGPQATKPCETRLQPKLHLGVSCTENHNIPPPGDGDDDATTNRNKKMFTYEEFDLMLRSVLHEFSTKPELTSLLAGMTKEDIFHACLHVDFDELREKIRPHLSPDTVHSEILYRTSDANQAAGTSKSLDVDEARRTNARRNDERKQQDEVKTGDRDSKTNEKLKCNSLGSSPTRKDGETSKQTAGVRFRLSSKSPVGDRGKDNTKVRPGINRTPGDSPDKTSDSSDTLSSVKTMCQELYNRKLEECAHKCQNDRCDKNGEGESRKCVDKPKGIPNYTLFNPRAVDVNVTTPRHGEKSHRKIDKILPFDTLSRITESPIESLSSADYAIRSKRENESFGQGKETPSSSDRHNSTCASSIGGNNKGDFSNDGTKHGQTRFEGLHGSSSGRKLHRIRSVELMSQEEESSPDEYESGVSADTSTSYNTDGLRARRIDGGKKKVRVYGSARDDMDDDDGSFVSREAGNSDRETHRTRKHVTSDERRRTPSAVSVSHTSETTEVFYYPIRTQGNCGVSSRNASPNATKASRADTPAGTRGQRTERRERKCGHEERHGKEDRKTKRDRSRSLRRQRSGSRHRDRTTAGVGSRERRHAGRREDAKRKHGGADGRPELSEMLSNPRFVVSLKAINSTVYRGQCSREEMQAMHGAAQGLRSEFIELNKQKSSSTHASRQCHSTSTRESKRSTNKGSRSSVFSTLGEIPTFAKEFFHNILGGHSTNMRVQRNKPNSLPDKQFSYFNHLADAGPMGQRNPHDSSREEHGSKLPRNGEKDARTCFRKSEGVKIIDEWKKTDNLLNVNKHVSKFTLQNAQVPPGCKSAESERLSSLGSSTAEARRRNDVGTSSSYVGAAKPNTPIRISPKNLELASEYLVNKYSVEESVGQENHTRSEVKQLKGIFTNKVKFTNHAQAIITKNNEVTLEKRVTKPSHVDGPSEKNVTLNTSSLPPVSIKNSKGISLKESRATENLSNNRSFLFKQLVGDWRDCINKSKKPNKEKNVGNVSGSPRPKVTAAVAGEGSRNGPQCGDVANIAVGPHRPAPKAPSSSEVSSTFDLGWFSQTGYRVEPAVAIVTTPAPNLRHQPQAAVATGHPHPHHHPRTTVEEGGERRVDLSDASHR